MRLLGIISIECDMKRNQDEILSVQNKKEISTFENAYTVIEYLPRIWINNLTKYSKKKLITKDIFIYDTFNIIHFQAFVEISLKVLYYNMSLI